MKDLNITGLAHAMQIATGDKCMPRNMYAVGDDGIILYACQLPYYAYISRASLIHVTRKSRQQTS